MKKHYIHRFFHILIIVLLLCIFGLIIIIIQQNRRIDVLKEKVDIYSAQMVGSNSSLSDFTTKVSIDGFDYLAIGNSITVHSKTSYWWGEWGMAATDCEKDYYHIFTKYLEDINKKEVNSFAFNYSVWEFVDHDRAETFELLDGCLTDNIDLVSIQLSENCVDVATLKSDYLDLIMHIKKQCGSQVKILIIDDFWEDEKSLLKSEIVSELKDPNVIFVDLSEVRGDEEYMVGMNTEVKGEDGSMHTIEHEGVSKHPGDKGMKMIAKKMIEVIN